MYSALCTYHLISLYHLFILSSYISAKLWKMRGLRCYSKYKTRSKGFNLLLFDRNAPFLMSVSSCSKCNVILFCFDVILNKRFFQVGQHSMVVSRSHLVHLLQKLSTMPKKIRLTTFTPYTMSWAGHWQNIKHALHECLHFDQWSMRLISPAMPSGSPRNGTCLTRPDPRPQTEGTLFWVPVQQVEPSWTGLMPMTSTTWRQLY